MLNGIYQNQLQHRAYENKLVQVIQGTNYLYAHCVKRFSESQLGVVVKALGLKLGVCI